MAGQGFKWLYVYKLCKSNMNLKKPFLHIMSLAAQCFYFEILGNNENRWHCWPTYQLVSVESSLLLVWSCFRVVSLVPYLRPDRNNTMILKYDIV